MTRPARLLVLVASLMVLVAGSALATQSPRTTPQGPAAASQEEDAPPSAEELQRAAERLNAQDIDATADQLAELAETYGLGGAVRLLAWADATGMSVADLRALRDDGAGWGSLAHDLSTNDVDLSPGIGWIMGNGGGHGPENAPGQLKPKPAGGDDAAGGSSAE
jgi:hypothetical protein